MALAEGLAAIGRSDESKALIDESIRQVEVSGEMFYMPELLRIKGGLLLVMREPDVNHEVEIYFAESLERVEPPSRCACMGIAYRGGLREAFGQLRKTQKRTHAFAVGLRGVQRGI